MISSSVSDCSYFNCQSFCLLIMFVRIDREWEKKRSLYNIHRLFSIVSKKINVLLIDPIRCKAIRARIIIRELTRRNKDICTHTSRQAPACVFDQMGLAKKHWHFNRLDDITSLFSLVLIQIAIDWQCIPIDVYVHICMYRQDCLFIQTKTTNEKLHEEKRVKFRGRFQTAVPRSKFCLISAVYFP